MMRKSGSYILALALCSATALGAVKDRNDMEIRQALSGAAVAVGWDDSVDAYESGGCNVYLLMDDAGMISICAYPFESTARTALQAIKTGDEDSFHGMPSWKVRDPEGAASTFTWQGKRFVFSAAVSDWQLEKTAAALYESSVLHGLLPADRKPEPEQELPPVIDATGTEPGEGPREEDIAPPAGVKPDIEEAGIVMEPRDQEDPPKKHAFVFLKPRVKFTSMDKSPTALSVAVTCRNIDAGSILRGELKSAHGEQALQTVPAIVSDTEPLTFRFPAPFMGWTPGSYVIEIQMKNETLARGTVTLP